MGKGTEIENSEHLADRTDCCRQVGVVAMGMRVCSADWPQRPLRNTSAPTGWDARWEEEETLLSSLDTNRAKGKLAKRKGVITDGFVTRTFYLRHEGLWKA